MNQSEDQQNMESGTTTSFQPLVRHVIISRPNCPHVVLERIYGLYRCDICQQIPQLGWIYACRQDFMLHPPSSSLVLEVFDSKDDDSQFEKVLQVGPLEFNKSIIDGVRDGHYTPSQIEFMVDQKVHLKAVIAEAGLEEFHRDSRFSNPGSLEAGSSAAKGLPSEHAGGCANDSSTTQGSAGSCGFQNFEDCHAETSGLRRKNRSASPCQFRCCHTCRPSYQERIYDSIDGVLAGEVRPFTQQDMLKLPVKNAWVASTIGLTGQLDTPSDQYTSSESNDECTVPSRETPITRDTQYEDENPTSDSTGRFALDSGLDNGQPFHRERSVAISDDPTDVMDRAARRLDALETIRKSVLRRTCDASLEEARADDQDKSEGQETEETVQDMDSEDSDEDTEGDEESSSSSGGIILKWDPVELGNSNFSG